MHRRAFTLIEVLISVLILSTSIFYVMKIYSQNHAQAQYINKRNIEALEDSLFLTNSTLRYDKERKNAYDLLHYMFKDLDNKSRQFLRKTERTIRISEPLKLRQIEGKGPQAEVKKIILKDSFSSGYYRFKIKTF
jgi:prepilin-type N-terminal cleavage/methylation domain-containing protein